ncbi:YDG domain-containing protein [Flavobacterium sp.]|uniref:YDG domain-containing protein n=1 Tax=Flavobacterium sp. TaxID=239 RepID=UPI0037C0E75D
MKLNLLKTLVFACVLVISLFANVSYSQASESFTNLPTANSTNYQARSWTGDNGAIWTATLARTDQTITGKAICFDSSGSRAVTSPSYSGGMGLLTFDYVRAFTGTNARSIEVWVNGSKIGSTITVSATSNTVVTYSQNINIVGNITLEIRSVGSAQVKIDNITWTAYSPASPVVTGGTVNGIVGTALTDYQIVATNSPTSYAITNGTLPDGLSLNTATGVISGTPTTAGSSSVDVTATNGSGTSTAATLSFVIAKGNQTITFNTLANRQYGDANFNLSATASSGLTVSYMSSNPLVATISGNTVTIVGEGTTNITASQSGNANYNAATDVIRSLTVTKRQLTVSGLTGVTKVYDGTTAASATGTATLSGILPGDESNVSLSGTPSYAFATATVGTNKTINTTNFSLSGPSAANYDLIQPTLTADITTKLITVSGATANNKVYDGTTTAIIVGGTLNDVETIDIANVSLASTGSFDTANVGENKPVTVSLTGSSAFNYQLTQPGITASITIANQTITFNALPTLNTNSTSLNLNLYASASSGLALTYESSNPAVVSVSGSTLTVVGVGTAVITASQDGNTNYNPAVDATQNVTVNLAPSVIAGWDFSTLVGGTNNFGPSPLVATTTNSNVTVVGLTRGSGIGTTGAGSANAWGGNGWNNSTNSTNAVTNNDFVTFSITTNVGYTSSFETVEPYNIRRSGTGPTTGLWQYQINSDGFVTIGSEITWGGTTSAAGNNQSSINLSAISALQNLPPNTVVTFRILNYSSSNAAGTWNLNDPADTTALDFTITGYVNPVVITEVTWNGTEWSNIDGPDATIDAIIAGAYATGTNGEFTSKKLTVTSGSLTVNSGTSITVEDVLENELTAAEVVVENNANLIQSNDVTNIGSITVQRNSAEIMRLDYTLWSSPVVGQNLLDFSPQTMANRFYVYNPGNNQYAAVIPSTNDFIEGNGYLIRAADNHPTSPTTWAGTFVGEPNNGNVSVSVANNTYNAVGNPYPSTISADDFMGENGLTEALYFWRKTNAATGSAYATYTLAGGAGTGSSGSNAQVPNGTIQVGQGFIARATSTSLVFTNQMRTANQANQFFRSENENRSRIWLNLNDSENLVGQTMIAYMEGTTTEVDAKYDGKYINDSQTAFTSLINNEEFAVQARGEFISTDVVPMSIKIENAGAYSISLAQVDGLFTMENDIYLRDNITGEEHDLRNAAYNFTIDSGVFNNRFELIYQSALSVENPTFSNVLITTKNKIIEINSGNELIQEVKVFDMRGRLLAQQSNVNASSTALTLVEVASQVLIVQITSDNGKVTSRKVVH